MELLRKALEGNNVKSWEDDDWYYCSFIIQLKTQQIGVYDEFTININISKSDKKLDYIACTPHLGDGFEERYESEFIEERRPLREQERDLVLSFIGH